MPNSAIGNGRTTGARIALCVIRSTRGWMAAGTSTSRRAERLRAGELVSGFGMGAAGVTDAIELVAGTGTSGSARSETGFFPNASRLSDNAGDTEPWIELHNAGTTALSLDGVSLADDYSDLTCWSFSAGTMINPGEYLLVWADGEPGESVARASHTKFRLNPTNGTVVLSRRTADGPQILDYFNYRDVGTNRSFGSYPPGQASYRQVFYFPTPRGTNDPHAPLVPLFLNEWLASNTRVLADPADQDFDDWFEIYNPTTNRVELAGYCLTDNLNGPNKFVVPAGITIAPEGYLLVWADEESSQTRTNGDLHVNFRLGQAGETLTLFAPDGRVVDSITFGPQTNNISQGRLPDGVGSPYVFFPAPTPRRANSLAASTIHLQIAIERDSVKLCWPSEPQRGYRVECKADLNEPTWAPCGHLRQDKRRSGGLVFSSFRRNNNC